MTIVQINNSPFPVTMYRGQRVVTFAMVDEAHKRPKGTALRNYKANRKHFVEGHDFFLVGADEFRLHKSPELGTKFVPSSGSAVSTNSVGTSFGKNASQGIFLTETGYLMVVKSLKDDLAWKVQRELVERYFRNDQSKELLADLLAIEREEFEREPMLQQIRWLSAAMGCTAKEICSATGYKAPSTIYRKQDFLLKHRLMHKNPAGYTSRFRLPDWTFRLGLVSWKVRSLAEKRNPSCQLALFG